AERVLFIGWGHTLNGREERGLEVFNDALGLYGRLQQAGRIERFDVVLLRPNTSLSGYMELHGSMQQLADLSEDEEFRRILTLANLCVEDLSVVEGFTNEGLAPQMEIYRDVLAAVPQQA